MLRAINLLGSLMIYLIAIISVASFYHRKGPSLLRRVGQVIIATRLRAAVFFAVVWIYLMIGVLWWVYPLSSGELSFLALVWIGGLIGTVMDIDSVVRRVGKPSDAAQIYIHRLEHEYRRNSTSAQELTRSIEKLVVKSEQSPPIMEALRELAKRDDSLGTLVREALEGRC